jgi:diacylglycerol kinase (ATP)
MSRDNVSLIINPTAGRGKAGHRMDRICEILELAGVTFDLYQSKAVRDLESQVNELVNAGARKIVVAGGDGTVHEAVNGIMRADRDAQLGLIPTGTGNDFAKACWIPLDWELATRQLADRLLADERSRRVDIGRMNDRYFANGAGIGFDAKVTRLAREYRWPIGDLVYLFSIFRCMVDGIETPHVTISASDINWSGPVTLVNVSNGAWLGGMFHIAPEALNNDGQLDMIIVDPVTRLRISSLIPKLVRGTHIQEAEITHASVRKLSIVAAETMPSHLDGEVGEPGKRFDIDILPDALELL